MNLPSIFKKQLTEAGTMAPLYFIEIDGKETHCRSVSVWKMGTLVNAHSYLSTDQEGRKLPVFRKRTPLSKP